MRFFDLFKKRKASLSQIQSTIDKVSLRVDSASKNAGTSNTTPLKTTVKQELVIQNLHPPSHVGEREFGFSLVQTDTGWHLLIKHLYAKPGSCTQEHDDLLPLPTNFFELYNTMELVCGYLYSISPTESYFPKNYENWKDKDKIKHFLIPSTKKFCSPDSHSFGNLIHRVKGAECSCQKCGLIEQFREFNNKEAVAFLEKYKDSDFDFYLPAAVGPFEHRYNEISNLIAEKRLWLLIAFGMNLKATNYYRRHLKKDIPSTTLTFHNNTYIIIRKCDEAVLSEERFSTEESAFSAFVDHLINDFSYDL